MDAAAGTMQAAAGACSFVCQKPGTMAARYIYTVLFLFGNVAAWWLRENPKEFFRRQRISGCQGSRVCLASESVLIVSMTFFLFYSVMFVTTVCTRNIHDRRNSWHSGWWPAKVLLLVGCFEISSVASSNVIQLYGKAARLGAGAFLFIQLISVIRYITRLSSRWCGEQNFPNHKRKVNTVSKLAFVCSVVGIVLMILFYLGCYVNVAFVSSAVMLVYLMPIISLLNKANKGFYMEPAIMGVYVVFLFWSSIKSEPETSCYKKQKTGPGANWITIVSFVVELTSIAVAAFSTGTDYKCLQFTNAVVSGNDVPYGYGFFHFVFAMGSMYFGMLFLGWETHHASEKWSMDVGWTSTVVHLVNAGLVVIFFGALTIARRFGIGWLQQLLGKIFGIGGQEHDDNDQSDHTEPPRGDSEMQNVPPLSTEPRGPETDNVVPPLEEEEPRDDTEHERSEMDDGIAGARPGSPAIEPEGRSAADNEQQPSSSSSRTTELLRAPDESQSAGLGFQSEITEEV